MDVDLHGRPVLQGGGRVVHLLHREQPLGLGRAPALAQGQTKHRSAGSGGTWRRFQQTGNSAPASGGPQTWPNQWHAPKSPGHVDGIAQTGEEEIVGFAAVRRTAAKML